MTSKRDVEVALADYKNKLTFEWKEDCVIITKPYVGGPKGKEEWSTINDIIRNELGGKWVSLGKESHWVVPLEVEQKVVEKAEVSGVEKREGNNGTFGTLHCPYCGKRIEITFRPEKEA